MKHFNKGSFERIKLLELKLNKNIVFSLFTDKLIHEFFLSARKINPIRGRGQIVRKLFHLQNSMNYNLVLESTLHSGVLESNILLTSQLIELGGSHSPESYVHFTSFGLFSVDSHICLVTKSQQPSKGYDHKCQLWFLVS